MDFAFPETSILRQTVDFIFKPRFVQFDLPQLGFIIFQLSVQGGCINFFADGEFKIGKGKSVGLIDSRISSINQSFAFIHQATMLRAGIYCNEGELVAMSTVLNEYSYFIEGTVAKNAGLLAQCDKTDTGTEKGIWKSRAKLKLDVSDFNKQLNAPDKTIYLGVSKENE